MPCWPLALLLAAYGSAVAGLGTCGLGRRTGAVRSGPDGWMGAAAGGSRAKDEGGLAVTDLPAGAGRDVEDDAGLDLTGEKCD